MRRGRGVARPKIIEQHMCLCCRELYFLNVMTPLTDHLCQECRNAETITDGLPAGSAVKSVQSGYIPLYTSADGWMQSYTCADGGSAMRKQSLADAKAHIQHVIQKSQEEQRRPATKKITWEKAYGKGQWRQEKGTIIKQEDGGFYVQAIGCYWIFEDDPRYRNIQLV